MNNAVFNGVISIIMGMLLIFIEINVENCTSKLEAYVGCKALNYLWLIFGIGLIIIGFYILVNNNNNISTFL